MSFEERELAIFYDSFTEASHKNKRFLLVRSSESLLGRTASAAGKNVNGMKEVSG